MKKILTAILLLSLVMAFAACSEPNATIYYGNQFTTQATTGRTDGSQAATDSSQTLPQPPVPGGFPNQHLAEECLLSIFTASSADDIIPYLAEDSQHRAQELLEHYNKPDATVTAEYSCSVDGYDVYHYTAIYSPAEGEREDDYVILQPHHDRYVVTIDTDVVNHIKEQKRCHSCSGSGVLTTGNRTVCGICSGTGFQYIPNAYYDSATNMWMGQNIGCGGCGGAGYTGIGSNVTCGSCNGSGVVFD